MWYEGPMYENAGPIEDIGVDMIVGLNGLI